jgi:signal transduction histidine kinase
VAELESENEGLKAYAHTVAHDLKGHLHHLSGYASYLTLGSRMISSDELAKCLGIIHRRALQMSGIIDELLLLAELRQGEIELAQVDMARVVQEALDHLTHHIQASGAQIVVPRAWPAVRSYAPWIRQVWVNYIDNAIKHGGSPPHVEIGAERTNGATRFWVRDNGPGLTFRQQDQVFVPFVRLDRCHPDGHGLGLSIVRHIVEKLGGTVGVESDGVAGAGCLFTFTLPVATGDG